MVMEVPPSPQIVGCEFVRQYYTLLNQAPAHLHRFYSENSLFIHGGLDVPNRETKQVVGQVQIHEHIQQLNFRDCHAKISQVDSQATLGNGVVVQVSGELSNGGQPMRRFTQTFVLAAQSPKKYYVHNDIFRYQDLLVDEEADLSRSEDEGECESSTESVQNGQSGDYYPTSGVADALNGGSQLIEETSPAFPPPPAVTQPVPEITQAPLPTPSPAPVVPAASQQFTTVKQVEESVVDAAPPSPPVKEEEEWGGSDQWGDSTPIETPLAPSPPPPVSNEPKTYANLLKSGPGSQSYSNVSSGYQKPSSPPPASLQKSSDPINSSSRDSLPPPRTSLPPSQPSRGPRPGPVPSRGGIRDRPPQTRASFSEDNDSEKSMGYRSGPPRHSGNFIPSNGLHFNDNQQLFMGNIPLHAQEDELRALFGQFGTILDLKIFSKAGLKGPTNRVPNYGFLIYEDPNTVETVLQNRPIYFPSRDDPSAVKLNVEEKKRRTPGPPDSRPPMDNRPRGGGAPMRGSRGGSRGGGMYRGGESRGNMPPNTNSQGLRNSTSNSYKPR